MAEYLGTEKPDGEINLFYNKLYIILKTKKCEIF